MGHDMTGPDELRERAWRALEHGDAGLSLAIIAAADAWQDNMIAWAKTEKELRARIKDLERDFDVMRHAKQDRIEELERALGRAEQTIRNAAVGFARGDVRTILLNEARNCAAALAGKE